jgi:Fe-only nitrogenase accessory protein AnfO
MKIAVFLNEQGLIAALTEPGAVVLYTRENQHWQVCRQIPFTLAGTASLADIRQHTLAMLALMPECRHFVAREIHGALLAWFDGSGLTMWQSAGTPEAALNIIAQQLPAPPEPVALLPQAFVHAGPLPGEFHVDLIAALRCGGSHTSKQLLVPLMQQESFTRLEIRCDHVPKWFDRLAQYQLSVASSRAPDGNLQVVVSKKVP